MVGRWIVAGLLGACLVFSPGVGNAAEFQLVDDLSTTDTTSNDNTAPCKRAAAAVTNVTDTSGVAAFEADSAAKAAGTDASCSETAQAQAKAHGTFTLAPTMMENPGDPVTVCIHVELADAVVAEDNALAKTEQDPVLLKATSGSISRTLIRLHLETLEVRGDNDTQKEFECGRQVSLAIGDQLEGFLGGTSTAKVSGIGAAAANTSYEMLAEVGECASEFTECPDNVAAPAISPLPLAVLAGLMLLSGIGVVRLRRMQ